ncbi:putative quinol monooxygenase [Parachryseolinea silvisoli]|uniref:putative quinol monooxygenase n=1 Tax=Parachryseolinea silvisoli TaxID=2873601 RepID=UPI0022657E40|nr:antibiotic biosynthesis monooxygenase [Parachryseolinea silvisoli]MCD9014178.1 antibiotic biosynthesis monooxygenase [Parachryseolinea silvisoli]
MKPILFLLFNLIIITHSYGQGENKQMVRLAKLVIDSTQLEIYNTYLKEEIETSIKKEPGVLTLYAIAEKARPTHITILEIYATPEAYRSHIKTPHFLKYKNGTKEMVKSLELIEGIPLLPAMKIY